MTTTTYIHIVAYMKWSAKHVIVSCPWAATHILVTSKFSNRNYEEIGCITVTQNLITRCLDDQVIMDGVTWKVTQTSV